MGVVRREGDWRLEKLEDGIYEITYQRDAQVKVVTPEYKPGNFENPMIDTIPVREVGSYAEAEGLFEESAHGESPGGFGLGEGSQIESLETNNIQSGELGVSAVGDELEDFDAPPGLIAIGLVIVGGATLSSQGWQPSETVFQAGVIMTIAGLSIVGWGVAVGKSKGWKAAKERLFETEKNHPSSQTPTNDSGVETTPPAPEKTKNTLIFERAEQRCEWCGERSDHLEVHHIEPRSEGGSNKPSNLIVLCPNHHRQADAGGISKTKLKAKVRRLPEVSVE